MGICRSATFVEGDEVTGVLDWSEAGPGDALYDLATLTLGHEENLGDVVADQLHGHRRFMAWHPQA
jgi:aminoglycoside phosphotransferase (APT) family kinase protein